MWATNNSHDALVRVLLDHGASSTQKSARGRTVFDFVNKENRQLVESLTHNPRDSVHPLHHAASATVLQVA